MFHLGEAVRRHYDEFIPMDPHKVYAAAEEDETLQESAATLLAGLAPPKERWIWNDNLTWQPIYITTDKVSILLIHLECKLSWNLFPSASRGSN